MLEKITTLSDVKKLTRAEINGKGTQNDRKAKNKKEVINLVFGLEI